MYIGKVFKICFKKVQLKTSNAIDYYPADG